MQYKNVSQIYSLLNNSPVESLNLFSPKQSIIVDVKRDDLIHSVISGNKWRKLKHLLLKIEKEGFKKIATMAGPYSNFAHALSYICYLLGWQCDLYIRGYIEQTKTPTLIDCEKWKANIYFVNRNKFRELREKKPSLANDVFWIPEGGLHRQSLYGLKELLMECYRQYDYIVTASATGTSVAGLMEAAVIYQPYAKIIGISVLNNVSQQNKDIALLTKQKNGTLIEEYQFGGFAKADLALEKLITNFYQQYKIPLEPIYNGKSFFAVKDLIEQGYFKDHSRILIIHCGGLQGLR